MSLEFLQDKLAIEQVYIRYCEAIDNKQFDALSEVFVADTYHDYTQALGPGVVVTSLDQLLGSMRAHLGDGSNCGATQHNVNNFRIGVDGDTARAKVNYYAVHRGIGKYAGALYSMWGLYDDELVRTAAGWRVARRKYTTFLTEGPVVTSRG
jgi:3-phenylpropionate/cinnamic acid dioxygenase small subunit